MKELSIKEKAERYDELLEKLRKAKVDNDVCDERYCCVIDDIVPELKESEDERIRKALIRFHKSTIDIDGIKGEQIVAWLEKQGEQKPADKVEPKFKVKYAGSEYNVLEVKDIAGVTYYGIEDEPNHIDYIKAENCEIISGYAIKENGSPYPTKSAVFSEQNPVWSEEDDLMLKSFVNLVEMYYGGCIDKTEKNKMLDWLKSLKDKYTWKPSDEQIEALEHFVRSVGESGYASPYNNNTKLLYSLLSDLKKLKG